MEKHRETGGDGGGGEVGGGGREGGRESDRKPECSSVQVDRLVGLVVKASASRAEGPGFESRLRRDFFGVESYQ